MPKKRKPSPSDMRALVQALRQVGASVEVSSADLEVQVGAGRGVTVRPVVRSVLSAGRAADVVRTLERVGGVVPAVIAPKIPAPAREVLNEAGVGWFDRRGHVRLVAPGLLIDTDVPPALDGATSPAFPAGRTGLGAAVSLLITAASPGGDDWAAIAPTVTEVADLSGVAVSGASTALKTFRTLGYLDGDGRPVVPDLFWATAEHWARRWVSLARPVDSDPRLAVQLGANLDDLGQGGWCLGGDAAAAAWGAPIVGGDVGARQWYVPTDDVLDTLRWTLGEIDPGGRAADLVAVAPTPAVCRRRVDRSVGAPVEPLAAAALDLALDQARGPETLEQWEPDAGVRVW